MPVDDFFDTEKKNELIKSVQYNDRDILLSIRKLYLGGDNFDLDPCFSEGKFYGDLKLPKHRMDKHPKNDSILENDIMDGIPLESKSLNGIVFDPPFMFGKHGKTDSNKMTKRFTMFDNWNQLESMYKAALVEFYRLLRKGGIVAFKCQDYTDSRTTLTHCFVHHWAMLAGFKVEDLFILVFTGGRIWNPNLIQRHSRKYHSYWFVLKK